MFTTLSCFVANSRRKRRHRYIVSRSLYFPGEMSQGVVRKSHRRPHISFLRTSHPIDLLSPGRTINFARPSPPPANTVCPAVKTYNSAGPANRLRSLHVYIWRATKSQFLIYQEILKRFVENKADVPCLEFRSLRAFAWWNFQWLYWNFFDSFCSVGFDV